MGNWVNPARKDGLSHIIATTNQYRVDLLYPHAFWPSLIKQGGWFWVGWLGARAKLQAGQAFHVIAITGEQHPNYIQAGSRSNRSCNHPLNQYFAERPGKLSTTAQASLNVPKSFYEKKKDGIFFLS